MAAPIATAGAAAPAHQYASLFLRAARPIVRPGAMERARAARGPRCAACAACMGAASVNEHDCGSSSDQDVSYGAEESGGARLLCGFVGKSAS